MRLRGFIILMLACFGFCGCRSSRHIIQDYQLYDTGEMKQESTYYSSESLANTREYFQNGRLKSEEWSRHHKPLVKLKFYDDSQLMSEERFLNGKITYAVYYTEDGSIDRTIGQILSEEQKPKTP